MWDIRRIRRIGNPCEVSQDLLEEKKYILVPVIYTPEYIIMLIYKWMRCASKNWPKKVQMIPWMPGKQEDKYSHNFSYFLFSAAPIRLHFNKLTSTARFTDPRQKEEKGRPLFPSNSCVDNESSAHYTPSLRSTFSWQHLSSARRSTSTTAATAATIHYYKASLLSGRRYAV